MKKNRSFIAMFSKMSLPSICTVPSSGCKMPASMRRNVDLPAPFEPIRPYTEPSLTSAQMNGFGLDENRKLRTFSKGMKKQVSVICGVCSGTDYLFCDETFDGLDPVVRQTVKSLFAEDVADRGLTPIIASHNLRELEDICDHVGLLHRGGILFSRDLDDMKLGMYKMQCIFPNPLPDSAWDGFDILHKEQRGSLYTITARGSREELLTRVNALNPTFCEMLTLTLEEIFINETEVAGYDVKKLLF